MSQILSATIAIAFAAMMLHLIITVFTFKKQIAKLEERMDHLIDEIAELHKRPGIDDV